MHAQLHKRIKVHCPKRGARYKRNSIKTNDIVFFEAKMTKIDILISKLIAPDDYQECWVHFEWFLALFHISDEKWLLS